MDDIFEHWFDKTGRTISLNNIKEHRTLEEAAWWALTELGYAGVSWDEHAVRVRIARTIHAGTVEGLGTNLRAVKRAIRVETWDGSAWSVEEVANGVELVAYLRSSLPKSQ